MGYGIAISFGLASLVLFHMPQPRRAVEGIGRAISVFMVDCITSNAVPLKVESW
jgi:uncharacterized membrane protein